MAQSFSPFPEGKLSDLATTAQESKVVISEKSEQSLKDLVFGSVRPLLLDDDKENSRLLSVNHSISPIVFMTLIVYFHPPFNWLTKLDRGCGRQVCRVPF